MHLLQLLPLALLASAAPPPKPSAPAEPSGFPAPPCPPSPPAAPTPPARHPPSVDPVKCPIIFDGRIRKNLTLSSFDNAAASPYNPDYVKGVNTTWSSILLLPETPPSRFDIPGTTKPLEVTIDNRSIFKAGDNLQVGFRRAGLLLQADANDPGADASDSGIVTFHWSVKQDHARPLNLSHEYMNIWHEKADYSGNQFMFVGGVVLIGDGGTGIDTKEEREKWRIQNAKNEFIFETKMEKDEWQNFGVQLDYTNK